MNNKRKKHNSPFHAVHCLCSMPGCLLAALLLLASCIRDDLEPCPPLSIKLNIVDKNYFNAEQVVQTLLKEDGLDLSGELLVDEKQPFRHYIQRLYYTLYNRDTQQLITTRRLHDVQGEAEMATVYDIPADLPYGNYALVVWGNIDSDEGIMGNGGSYDLHQDNVEGYDVYHGLLTFTYDEYHADFVCDLERVKGDLLILTENMPQDIRWSRKSVTGVSGHVYYALNYVEDDAETVTTVRDWTNGLTLDERQTDLAPTVEEYSTVVLQFFDTALPDDGTTRQTTAAPAPMLETEPAEVTMERNMITAMRYVYDETTNSFDIYVLIDDGWKVVNNMGVEE